MTPFAAIKQDKVFLIGLFLIPVSLFLFCIPFFSQVRSDSQFALFIPNYGITVFYFILLLGSKRLKKGREGLFPFFLFLVLFLISAYSLNREMVIFEKTVTWFAVLQVILCINYILFVFWESFPRLLQHSMVFLLGTSLITFFYMACYLAPVFFPGAFLFFALGISLHVFVPLLFVIYTIVLMYKVTTHSKSFLATFVTGAGFAATLIIGFVVWWSLITQTINKTYRQSSVSESNGLPGWVKVAQSTQHNWVTERALKADLVYTTFDGAGDFFWRIPSRNFNEERKHDPLVVMASFFAGKPNLSEENRIRLLESMYDSRHQSQERLWSGDDLWTEHIHTAVRIWPQYGLSYTEKEITVSNAAQSRGWNDQQEALYTFHFPEGAVATSLSLWIDGKEEPGILTTKQKADSAYKTIVGREFRDPSVIHWQEGNTVTVRVFPVLAGESRKFKIGITAPLNRRGKQMEYENIYCDGPSFVHAQEDVELEFQQRPQHFIAPAVFSQKGKQGFTRSGNYDPSWKIQLDDQVLDRKAFSFNGKSYTIHLYRKQRSSAVFKTIYLDVNKAWTKEEFDNVYYTTKGKEVYVYLNALVQLNSENKDELFNALHKNQFSVFPLFLIPNANNSLLISKSAPTSPNIKDLEDSRFMNELKGSLSRPHKIRLFNIGDHLSPYLRSLKEFRIFQYEHGSLEELKNLLSSQVFAKDIEYDNMVVIDNAEIAISQQEGEQPSQAPDHLMRLFAYNHIMQKMGPCLLTSEEATPELIDEAQKAYVVSPVSSLVVLETQKDYERFNIKDSENSLKNASAKSKGAVPEPHEWALIILAAGVVLFVKWKPIKRSPVS
jgi:XrtN system VIT domain protein